MHHRSSNNHPEQNGHKCDLGRPQKVCPPRVSFPYGLLDAVPEIPWGAKLVVIAGITINRGGPASPAFCPEHTTHKKTVTPCGASNVTLHWIGLGELIKCWCRVAMVKCCLELLIDTERSFCFSGAPTLFVPWLAGAHFPATFPGDLWAVIKQKLILMSLCSEPLVLQAAWQWTLHLALVDILGCHMPHLLHSEAIAFRNI